MNTTTINTTQKPQNLEHATKYEIQYLKQLYDWKLHFELCKLCLNFKHSLLLYIATLPHCSYKSQFSSFTLIFTDSITVVWFHLYAIPCVNALDCSPNSNSLYSIFLFIISYEFYACNSNKQKQKIHTNDQKRNSSLRYAGDQLEYPNSRVNDEFLHYFHFKEKISPICVFRLLISTRSDYASVCHLFVGFMHVFNSKIASIDLHATKHL